MNLLEKIGWYYRNHGLGALIGRVALGKRAAAIPLQSQEHEILPPGEEIEPFQVCPPVVEDKATPASQMLRERYPLTQPLPVYTAPGPVARINLVTDSISSGSLFGGVGTAIILATLLAKRCGAKLRIVTRTEAPDEAGFAQVIECNNIDYVENVEFAHVDISDQSAQLDVCEGDRFLTTSWWTTASTLESVPANKVDYLLQEDERMFYPYGDDWLRCSEVLERTDIRFLINSELLYKHLIGSGLTHLLTRARWFEPAFPESVFGTRKGISNGRKRRLFFYARPNNLRNLFFRGLEVLDKAVASGILDALDWEVVFVGKDVPKVLLGGVLEPTVLPIMDWREYGKFIASVDIGFCLMCTPHPSYPPLDLASSGALVLTNRLGLKQTLRQYSDNIICVNPSVSGLLDGLSAAIAAVGTLRPHDSAADGNRISRSWADSLDAVVEYLR